MSVARSYEMLADFEVKEILNPFQMVMSIDTPLSSFSKDSVISFSSPTSVSCELTKIEGIEEVRESRNDSYYTKHKHPNHVQPTNQRNITYIHTRESYIHVSY
jgi:hypothetical protein